MNDNRVQTNSPGFRLIPETATFLDLCIVASCGWIFIRLAAKIKGGATKELDETILRMLRHSDNLAIPRGRFTAGRQPLMKRASARIIPTWHRTGHEHPHFRAAIDNYAGLISAMGLSQDAIAVRVHSAIEGEPEESA